jgi:hypothetical protein
MEDLMRAAATVSWLGLVALAAAAGGARGQAQEWPAVHVEAYELDVVPSFGTGSLEATAVLHLVNAGPRAATEVPLLLNRLLRVTSVRAAADLAGPAGAEAPAGLDHDQSVVGFDDIPRLQVNLVRVRFPEPLAPGGRASIAVEYRGYLTGYTEVGWSYVRDRVDPSFTILREDAFAYPLVGVPSMAARMRAGLLEFRYTASITVPDTLVVANGGELVERQAGDGVTRYTYRSIAPSWRMDFAIAPYRVLEQGGTRVFHFPADSAGAGRVFGALGAAKLLYTEWFGPLHRSGGFTVIAVPEGWGSQTDVTSIIQTADAFADTESLVALYHEVSHLWNAPSRDDAPARWEEGLAVYLQYRVAEVLDGGPPVAERARATAERVRRVLARDPRLAEVPMIHYGRERMTDASYSIGMLMFAALDQRLGRPALDRIVGGYYQRYHETGGTTEDLVRLGRELSGGASDEIFDAWLRTTRWVDELEAWFPG